MSEDHYRFFKAIAITLALIVAALYFRYGYLSPHLRFDRWTGQLQTRASAAYLDSSGAVTFGTLVIA